MNEQRTQGMRELIRSASTVTEADRLLREARNFSQISAKTFRACERTAKRRIKQLKREAA